MEKYLIHIYRQYCESIGKKCLIENMLKDADEFAKWVVRNKKISDDYINLLYYYGINAENSEVTEINKGLFDSLLMNNMLMISPYANTLGKTQAVLRILNDTPYIITVKGKECELYSDYTITHNPYTDGHCSVLPKLRAFGLNVCLGVFGKIYDKDKDKKIKLVEDFRKQMILVNPNGITADYFTDKDNYFCIVKNEEKLLKKEKDKLR